MRKRIEVFCEMSSLAEQMCNMPDRECPEYAAAVQEMNRLRGEYCRVTGVAEQDISADGYNISKQAYESVRASWLQQIADHGATDWLVNGARQAHTNWMKRRPDLAAGDDWLAGLTQESATHPKGE